MVVYWHDGNDNLYPADAIDLLPNGTPESDSYHPYEIPDVITLTPTNLFEGTTVLEVLIRSGQAKAL